MRSAGTIKILFSPGWRTLGLFIAGMLPQKPWVMGANGCDYMVQQGHEKMAQFVRAGVPEHKCVLVGDPSLDQLFDSYMKRHETKKQLVGKYKLSLEKTIVVFAVPNEAEHGYVTYNQHLKTLDDYLQRIPNENIELLMVLHPKSSTSTYTALAKKFGAQIVDERLHTVIPIAQIFLAGVSTTNLWARLIGIPIITLNFLEIDAEFCEGPDGVFVVTSPNEIETIFPVANKYAVNGIPDEYRDHANELRRSIFFDGKSNERLLSFISTRVR